MQDSDTPNRRNGACSISSTHLLKKNTCFSEHTYEHHSFNRCLLRTYYMSATDTMMDMICTVPLS